MSAYKIRMLERDIVSCLFKYIDRMNDVCPDCDPADKILTEFTEAVSPLMMDYMRESRGNKDMSEEDYGFIGIGDGSGNLYADEERRINWHLKLAVPAFFVGVLLSVFGVLHWAVWVPGLIVNVGLIFSLGMQLNRIDELRSADVTPGL